MTGFENIRKNFGFGCMRLPIVLGGCRSYFARNKLCHNLCSIFPAACFNIIPIEQMLGKPKRIQDCTMRVISEKSPRGDFAGVTYKA